MKNKLVMILPALIAGSIMLTGCELVGSIFKAGMWVGTLGVLLVIGIVIFIFMKLFRRR